MSRCRFGCLVAVLLGIVAGCTPASTPGPLNRPAPTEASKTDRDNPATSRVTPPEHIPAK